MDNDVLASLAGTEPIESVFEESVSVSIFSTGLDQDQQISYFSGEVRIDQRTTAGSGENLNNSQVIAPFVPMIFSPHEGQNDSLVQGQNGLRREAYTTNGEFSGTNPIGIQQSLRLGRGQGEGLAVVPSQGVFSNEGSFQLRSFLDDLSSWFNPNQIMFTYEPRSLSLHQELRVENQTLSVTQEVWWRQAHTSRLRSGGYRQGLSPRFNTVRPQLRGQLRAQEQLLSEAFQVRTLRTRISVLIINGRRMDRSPEATLNALYRVQDEMPARYTLAQEFIEYQENYLIRDFIREFIRAVIDCYREVVTQPYSNSRFRFGETTPTSVTTRLRNVLTGRFRNQVIQIFQRTGGLAYLHELAPGRMAAQNGRIEVYQWIEAGFIELFWTPGAFDIRDSRMELHHRRSLNLFDEQSIREYIMSEYDSNLIGWPPIFHALIHLANAVVGDILSEYLIPGSVRPSSEYFAFHGSRYALEAVIAHGLRDYLNVQVHPSWLVDHTHLRYTNPNNPDARPPQPVNIEGTPYRSISAAVFFLKREYTSRGQRPLSYNEVVDRLNSDDFQDWVRLGIDYPTWGNVGAQYLHDQGLFPGQNP